MKKGLIVILAGVLAVAMGLGGLSVVNNIRNTKSFIADGYILDPSDEDIMSADVNSQYYFTQGTTYKQKYGEQILFKDTTGEKESIDKNHFIHYNDGSLGSFTKGVVMDITEIDEANYGYYSLTKNTVLVKNGSSYELTSRGEAMSLTEFVWKISDTDYMLVSPTVTLSIGPEEMTFADYAQITYVDNGIVRISHQTGTYQTVASDSELVTDQGAELNLVGKSFMVDGEPIFSLDDMAIDDDSYIDVDENVDAPTIPTFNVINGKDGASGTDGDIGEDGEDGEEGEEGEEGTEGTEGTAGAEGVIGSEGAAGDDGTEGDQGKIGFDGEDGEDASTALSQGGLQAVDLKARPSITMEALKYNETTGKYEEADNYNVSANSATMTFNLFNPDDSMVMGEGKTRYTLYNRETMQAVDGYKDVDASALESGSLIKTFSGLDSDTEYLLVISADYIPEEGGEAITTDVFRKVFKTSGVGIALEKVSVKENALSVKTVINGDVSSYSIALYEDGNDTAIATYSDQDVEKLFDFINGEKPTTGTVVKSNTKYYVDFTSVKDGKGASVVSSKDTKVEILTLKQTPFSQAEPHVPVTQMVPELSKNEVAHSLTLALPNVTDPDLGITGYRYELYKYEDYNAAVVSGNWDNLKPSFTKDSSTLTDITFGLPENDRNAYVGRVVALFNNNEEEVELNSQFSLNNGLEYVDNGVFVELRNINKIKEQKFPPDEINGYIAITDHNTSWETDSRMLRYVNSTNPLVVYISSESDAAYRLEFDMDKAKEKDDVIDRSAATWLVPFDQDGLRKNTTYTVTVRGPVDADGDGIIAADEKETYLTGMKITTGRDYSPLMLFGIKENDSQTAFRARVGIAPYDTEDEVAVASARYAAQRLDTVRFGLYHIKDGVETQIATTEINDSKDTPENDKQSDFYDVGWHDKSLLKNNVVQSEQYGYTVDSYKAVDPKDNNTLVLTPDSFGLPDKYNVFSSGGVFVIKVIDNPDGTYGSVDYTDHKNTIRFADSADLFGFEIEEEHLASTDPNNEIRFNKLTNGGAPADRKETGVSDSTTVGLSFKTAYPYKDIDEVHYYIYEVISNNDSETIDNTEVEDPTTQSMIIRPIYTTNDEAILGAGGRLDLKMFGVRSNVTNYSETEMKLYFKDNYTECAGDTMNWYTDTTKATPVGTTPILQRGHRYIVRYEIKVSDSVEAFGATHGGMGCTNSDLTYPYCIGLTETPFYRSPVIDLDRQVPFVERYPYTSDAASDTWMYRIVDPDDALVLKDGSDEVAVTIKKSAAKAMTSPTTVSTSMKKKGTDNYDWFTYTIGDLSTSKPYYTVSMDYKAIDSSSAVTKIESAVVLHRNVTTAPALLKIEGVDEAGVVNQGNYRYKVTVKGNDLNKYAAFRVTFTASGQEVVYDPVYLEYVSKEKTGEQLDFGYAYLDAAPLTVLAASENTTATVNVQGYYGSGVTGFKDYSVTSSDLGTGNLISNVYSFKTYKKDGTYEYSVLVDNNKIAYSPFDKELSYNSVFVPGVEGTLAGLSGLGTAEKTLQKSNAILSQRYAKVPLSVAAGQADQILTSSISTTIDESGIVISAGNVSGYLAPEKLSLSGNFTGTPSVDIGEVLPAIELVQQEVGSKSANLKMNLIGNIPGETHVYARLYTGEAYDQLLKVKKENRTLGDQTVTVFTPDGAGTDSDYTHSAFSTKDIPLSGGDKIVELKLSDLNRNEPYAVMFFMYSNGVEVPLYCPQAKKTGNKWDFRTKPATQLELSGDTYTYTSYDNKTANFDFIVKGTDGTGIRVRYEVKDSEGTLVASGEVEPNAGSVPYYASDYGINKKINIPWTPGGTMSAGEECTISLWAYDVGSDPTNPEGSLITKKFTPPNLTAPTVRVGASATMLSDGKKGIVATASITDSKKSIMPNGRNGAVYGFNLYDVNGSEDPLDFIPITAKSASSYETTATFELSKYPSASGEFKVEVVADIDLDNNNQKDGTQVKASATVNESVKPKAKITPITNDGAFKLSFVGATNCQSVTEINITLFKQNPEDGSWTRPFSGTFHGTLEDGKFVSEDGEDFTIVTDWELSPGAYEYEVSYNQPYETVSNGFTVN